MKPEELIKWAYVKPGTLVEVKADLAPYWEKREFAMVHDEKIWVYEEIYDDYVEGGKGIMMVPYKNVRLLDCDPYERLEKEEKKLVDKIRYELADCYNQDFDFNTDYLEGMFAAINLIPGYSVSTAPSVNAPCGYKYIYISFPEVKNVKVYEQGEE